MNELPTGLQGSELAAYWLAAIVESADDAVVSKTLEGVITSWNKGAERIFGYTADEAVGRSVTILIPEDHLDEEPAILARIRSGQRVEHYETVRRRKDGTLINISLTVSPIRDAAGRVIGASKIARDITERKRAEQELRESRERLRMAMDAADIYSWEMDPVTRRVEWSANVTRVLGFPLPADFESTLRLVHEEDRDESVRLILRAVEEGGVYEAEFRLVNPENGEVVWVRARGATNRGSEGGARFVGITQNITSRKLAAEALRESTEQYQATFERAGVGIGHTASDGRWLRVNQRLCDILGYAREEMMGLTFRDITHPDDLPANVAAMQKLLSGEIETYSTEKRYLHKNGSEVWTNLTVSPLRDSSGGLKYFISVVEDITERKRAEAAVRESESQLRTLADAVPQLVWMARPDGHVFWYNRRWYDYTGMTPEQMEGWGWRSVHDPEMLPRVIERWKASLETGETFEMEFPLRGTDGVFRWFLTRVSPLRDSQGRIVRWFGTNTDVDEQRRTAQQLREANRLKDEFLATVSHELRTPLTAILGWAHLLRAGQIDEKGAGAALETIERNARAQAQLIDDLLDVSRIITGKLRLDVRQVDPASFIESAVEALRPAAEAKGVRVLKVLDAGTTSVSGDPTRLQQVVWNLLSNSIKFTPRGGHVQVKLERAGSHVEITVSDTGAGIAPEFLPHVFDRFRQADQKTTRQHGGLGLGLAIVRHLVELHGGTVQAESPGEGRGATFVVRLPVAPVYQKESPARATRPKTGEARTAYECLERLDGLKVLVVEDEPDARELLRVGLGRCGAEVRTASSVPEALAALEGGWPDLLISDIGMPGEDGYDLIRRVRALPAEGGGRVPAIALTAYARTEDRLQALRAGYQMHVPKPADLDELVTVAASLVRRTNV